MRDVQDHDFRGPATVMKKSVSVASNRLRTSPSSGDSSGAV